MKQKKSCRCCKSSELGKYLNLGVQPLANSYHKGEVLLYYPLEVMLCKKCFHSQLSIVVDPDEMFKNYLYVSGTTKTFHAHCKSLAADAMQRVKKNPHVLDIACNDGTQLEYFRELGASVTGVDPAENLRAITKEKKIPVTVEYWSKLVAQKIAGKCDIITATNVFAHVDDSDEFLNAARIALAENGILIIEFPYGLHTIEQNEFDQVYHEHLSYFLVNSFATLATRLDFHIIDVLQTSVHGGSIRFFLQKGKGEHSKKVSELIVIEKEKGLLEISTYSDYAKRVDQNKKKLQTLVKKLKAENKKVIGYGASAKGNTMLNFFKINLDYIIDDNELKWGYATPGRNIFIAPPALLESETEALTIIILSWNFGKEIASSIWKRRKRTDDRAVLYVPKVISAPVNTIAKSAVTA